ncbi:hypothetical protein [Laribacter hongkongensis]|uniref:CopG family transcriptional regulator n=1 Tax=Laribacter hongkongensis TaxID=168471 RepID=A0A248LIP7_9NEIS|nr:hypothetical protein [Laribacter hongkongensis]ASJ24334.1 hypothetical protein LHGZ1_1503 [Laribacter hongkongensis]MCG9042016.1 hypothetical protein [Laribacter hongkongensis]MCG9068980.1 hypothetical protein [Laribacter hongkongensis]MCG9087738.1 hypothetical protein [Laribacter hongkongensis]MCG9110853.1 hypothetical protein [Laribacter hongkongensis]
MNAPRKRAPRGMQSDKPVAVRFSPEEKEELIKLAQRDNRTQSSMARHIYLIGLRIYKTTATTV